MGRLSKGQNCEQRVSDLKDKDEAAYDALVSKCADMEVLVTAGGKKQRTDFGIVDYIETLLSSSGTRYEDTDLFMWEEEYLSLPDMHDCSSSYSTGINPKHLLRSFSGCKFCDFRILDFGFLEFGTLDVFVFCGC